MNSVNTHEAKTQFSRLLRRVAAGEEITIANRGVPVARLVPVAKQQAKRKLGDLAGQIWIADDFDAPLPDDLLALFEGREVEKPKRSSKRSKKVA
jgi:prevent-host-death family protein